MNDQERKTESFLEWPMYIIGIVMVSLVLLFAVDQGTKYLVDIDEQNGIHWPGHK